MRKTIFIIIAILYLSAFVFAQTTPLSPRWFGRKATPPACTIAVPSWYFDTATSSWKFCTGTNTFSGLGGAGTVTSVGLSLPSIFTVTNSPVTTSGTLTGTLASQSANTFFIAPNGSSGAPTFRALVAADLGTGSSVTTKYLRGDLTWQTVTAGITNGAGANVITKSDGTNLVASQITDNGTTVGIPALTTIGSATAIRQWTVRDLNGNNFAALYNSSTSGGIADTTYTLAAAAADTRLNSPAGGTVTLNIANAAVLTTTTGNIAITGNVDATGFVRRNGLSRVTADVTNATTTMASVTGLTSTLVAGRTYSFKLILLVSDSVAADGLKMDFSCGTVTATDFRAHGTLFDTALLLSTQTTALATDFAVATITGSSMVEIYGTITVNAGGTFIPCFAQNAHTAGTLTAFRGSNLIIEDIP